MSRTREEPCNRRSTSSETYHRHLAARVAELAGCDEVELYVCHLTLSVLRASNAQSTPRIQKRVTTCGSDHPFISK